MNIKIMLLPISRNAAQNERFAILILLHVPGENISNVNNVSFGARARDSNRERVDMKNVILLNAYVPCTSRR